MKGKRNVNGIIENCGSEGADKEPSLPKSVNVTSRVTFIAIYIQPLYTNCRVHYWAGRLPLLHQTQT